MFVAMICTVFFVFTDEVLVAGKDDLEEAEKIPERLDLPKKKRLTLRKALSKCH